MQSVVDEIFKAPSRPLLAHNAPIVLPKAHYGLMRKVGAYRSVDWHMLFVCLLTAPQSASSGSIAFVVWRLFAELIEN